MGPMDFIKTDLQKVKVVCVLLITAPIKYWLSMKILVQAPYALSSKTWKGPFVYLLLHFKSTHHGMGLQTAVTYIERQVVSITSPSPTWIMVVFSIDTSCLLTSPTGRSLLSMTLAFSTSITTGPAILRSLSSCESPKSPRPDWYWKQN